MNFRPQANVTMTFATEQQNGVLLYTGDRQHLAIELFRGRIRVSYDVGNYPVRYQKIAYFLMLISLKIASDLPLTNRNA